MLVSNLVYKTSIADPAHVTTWFVIKVDCIEKLNLQGGVQFSFTSRTQRWVCYTRNLYSFMWRVSINK